MLRNLDTIYDIARSSKNFSTGINFSENFFLVYRGQWTAVARSRWMAATRLDSGGLAAARNEWQRHDGQRWHDGQQRDRWTAAAAACSGGVRLFSVMSAGTLRVEMKR